MDLDAVDAAILRALQEDARASMRSIAKKVGVSVPTVSSRLKNLKDLGIVRGYRVVLDPDRLESQGISLIVKTKPRAAEEAARRIASRGWAQRVVAGRPGWILVDVGLSDPAGVESILKEVRAIPGVVHVEDLQGLRTVKDEPAILPRDGLTANVPCFECKGPIRGEPIRAQRDGRYHYFCCHTCERLYLERYTRVRAAARPRT